MHDRRTFGWISPMSFVRVGASTEEVDFGEGSNVAKRTEVLHNSTIQVATIDNDGAGFPDRWILRYRPFVARMTSEVRRRRRLQPVSLATRHIQDSPSVEGNTDTINTWCKGVVVL
jgi:hypothetical protein